MHDFDPDLAQPAPMPLPAPVPAPERSRPARLIARLYASGSAVHRSRLLGALLRPLSPLALVGVASGAFAGYVGRTAVGTLDDFGRFSREQIFELARFVEQVSPESLRRVAQALGDAGGELSAFAAAAALQLERVVGLGDRRAGAAEPGLVIYAA